MTRVGACACAGLFAGIVALCGAACTQPRAPTAPPDYFPLHADDTWVYEIQQPLRNQRTRMTVRVRDDRYVQSLRRRCQVVEESYADEEEEADGPHRAGNPEIHPVAYYREQGFLYRAFSFEYQGSELHEIGLGSAEERFLPDTLAHDVAWDSLTTAYDLGGGNSYGVRQTHHAVGEPGAIEVPAGRFAGCIRVDTVAFHGGKHDGHDEGAPVVLYYADWYAPNVGLIRSVESNRPDGTAPGSGPPLTQIELVAFDVEGAKRR